MTSISKLEILEALGLIGFGFCVFVLGYTLLTIHRLNSRGWAYFEMDLLTAMLVAWSLMVNFNLASALIQGIWIVFFVAAILARLKRVRQSQNDRRQAPLTDRSFG